MSFNLNPNQLSDATEGQLRRYCMDALARRSHSKHELKAKMDARGADEELSLCVIERLEAEGLQSDTAFIESQLNSALRKGYGPNRFFQSMSTHHLSSELIHSVLLEEQPDWFELAKRVYERKYQNASCLSELEGEARYKEQSKRARFLFGRGFTAEQIKYATQST